MRARITNLHDTELGWSTLCKQQKFIPRAGEFIVYDPDESHEYPRLKLGDGKTLLQNLPFCINAVLDTFIQEYRPPNKIDGGRIENYID